MLIYILRNPNLTLIFDFKKYVNIVNVKMAAKLDTDNVNKWSGGQTSLCIFILKKCAIKLIFVLCSYKMSTFVLNDY